MDSASVAEAVWPELAELKGTHFHDTLMSRRAAMSDTAADSLYHQPDVRLLQHILFSARNAPPPVKEATRKKAEATLARIRKGANFGQLAVGALGRSRAARPTAATSRRARADGSSRCSTASGGALQPGQTSGIVETQFGFHLIRRPAIVEVRERFTDFLLDRAGAAVDSTYMDSLAAASEIKVDPTAAATMRAALGSTEESRRSGKTIASYKGGSMTVQEFLRWVRALPPQYLQQLKSADDSTLMRFARVLTQNTLLLRQADAAGIQPSQVEWKGLERQYLAQLDTLKGEMGLTGSDLSDTTVSAGEREKVAGIKMEQYFDQLINGKARLRPLPSALASLLRERLAFRINQAGVGRAVDMAKEAKAKADSAAGPGPVRPAPGGPPIPGMVPGGRARPRAGRHNRRDPLRRPRRPTPRPVGSRAGEGDTRVRIIASAVIAIAFAAHAGILRAQDTTGTAAPAAPAAADSTPPDSTAAPIPAAIPAPVPTADSLPPNAAQPAAMPADSVIVVDRVVAVVGNRPVLASQVDEELFSRQAQGTELPKEADRLEALRREVVSSIVDEELLVQQAARDTAIQVTDQEVADGVEQQVKKVRGNFTSEVDYSNELKKAGFQTPEEYRRWLTDQQRRAALQNRLIDGLRTAGKLKSVSPTEAEMKKFFEQQKGNLGSRPATISFRQIVVAPKASAAAKARTRAQADSIVLELRQGADFATAARRFSQDPGSQRPGRLAQLVPPRCDGAGVRARRVQPQARRGVRPGGIGVRVPHHPGGADPAGRDSGSPHPAHARRSTRRTSPAPDRSPPGSTTWWPRVRRSTRCSDSTTTHRAVSGRRRTCPPTSCPRTTARPSPMRTPARSSRCSRSRAPAIATSSWCCR